LDDFAVPIRGSHPVAPAGLARDTKDVPRVILSTASNNQIHHRVAKLSVPF
jgi:hypothetical protein